MLWNCVLTACTRTDSPHNLSNPLLLLKYQNPQTLQPKSDPWDAQILQISKFVSSLGFQSFDELVGFYYSGEFEVGSMAHSKQKLSRGRNLPGVLRTLQDSTATWSVWESSGYRNEILHAAEDILVEEIDQAIAPMRVSDGRTKESTEESRCAGHGNIKLSLIEEVSTVPSMPYHFLANTDYYPSATEFVGLLDSSIIRGVSSYTTR